jgi:hypothetical protein
VEVQDQVESQDQVEHLGTMDHPESGSSGTSVV